MAPLRWGIFATGLIAHDFATAVGNKPESHQIAAACSIFPGEVDAFAAKFGVAVKFYSASDLAAYTGVDVIYIASLTSLHYEHAKLFLEAGRNVLCEKPLTLSAEQTRDLLELSRSKKCFFMAGLWSRFFPSYRRMRAAIDSGEIGQVRAVQGCFLFPKPSHIRRLREISMGGGMMADYGIYLVHLACWAFASERPESISVVGQYFSNGGADRCGVISLSYSDARMASLHYSADCGPCVRASVVGEKGVIELDDYFYCPRSVKINGKEYYEPTPEGQYNFPNSGGLLYEADHVKECIDKGLTESPHLPHSDCQLVHDIMDVCYSQLGLKYV